MRNPNCTACPLHKGAHNVCIDGHGPTDADILIVGQNPGQQEDRKGIPFIGPSGALLKGWVRGAELDSLKVRYTNLVRCVTPDNREPTAKEIKACKPYIDAEIARVKPRYVVTMGAPATRAVAKAKVSISHGQMIPSLIDGCVIMPTYHPAATFRDPSKAVVIQHDFARLQRYIDGTLGATQKAFKHRVVTDRETLREFLYHFDAANAFAYDTETNGLFIQKQDFVVRCIAVALADCSWVIPLEMPGSFYRGAHSAQAAFFRVLARKAEGKWVSVFHGKYDARVLRRAYSVSMPYNFDVMLAHYILDENQDHDLKYVSRIELDCPEYDLPKELKYSDTDKWLELMKLPENREKYWEYAARDGWNTLHLEPIFSRKLQRNFELRRLYYKLVMPSSRALETLEDEGLPWDRTRHREVKLITQVALDAAKDELDEYTQDRKEMNWDSPQQVGDVLYKKLKLPCTIKTPTGQPSTSEAAVVDLKGTHPIINKLLTYRGLGKTLNTYLEGWEELIVGNTIYFPYKQTGTVTGRFSSPLHPIPTDSDIRSIVSIGDDLEWEFFAADLSQAELRIAAEMSGDTGLIDAYRNGRDVHWETVLYMVGAGHMPEYAAHALKTAEELDSHYMQRHGKRLTPALQVMGLVGVDKCVSVWKGWKDARTRAKRINFGYLYGMYEKKFMARARIDYDWHCTWEEAHGFRKGFFELRPGLLPWHDRCKRIAHIDGYVTNMFGRRRRLPSIQSTDKKAREEAERQAVNARVQGTIGDWKSAAMIEISETIDRDKLRLGAEHHDALLGRVRRTHKDVVLPKMREIMRRPALLKTFKISMKVPMVVDINIGPWGKGASYHDPR